MQFSKVYLSSKFHSYHSDIICTTNSLMLCSKCFTCQNLFTDYYTNHHKFPISITKSLSKESASKPLFLRQIF